MLKMTIMNKTATATIHRLCFHLSVHRAAKKNKNDSNVLLSVRSVP